MKPLRRWLSLVAFACLLSVACVAAPAFAAEGGEQNPAEAPLGTLFRWLNFLLVFGGGGYFIAKKAPAFFRGRAEAVSAAINEAAAAKAAADKQLKEATERLGRLDQEVVELRSAAQRESAAEAERLRAVTRNEAEKIARAAKAEIEAAERTARIELKTIAARLAIERAGALIRQQLTVDRQASLFRTFLDDLARSAN